MPAPEELKINIDRIHEALTMLGEMTRKTGLKIDIAISSTDSASIVFIDIETNDTVATRLWWLKSNTKYSIDFNTHIDESESRIIKYIHL
mgnify:CR=1 FL=1